MRRLTGVAAFVAAGVLAMSLGPSAATTSAAGPPLRYLGGSPGTLDPAFISNAGDVQFLLQLYAGLTRLDETGEPYPSLASGWEISDDGLTYEFAIRDDLTFSDGTPLTAEDVRRSWLRLLDPATNATAPDVLSVVRGASERLAGSVGGGRGRRHRAGRDDPRRRAAPPRVLLPGHRRDAGNVRRPASRRCDRWLADRRGLRRQRPVRGRGSRWRRSGADRQRPVRRRAAPIDEVRWVGSIDGDAASAFAAGQVDLAGVPGSDARWISFDAELGPACTRPSR